MSETRREMLRIKLDTNEMYGYTLFFLNFPLSFQVRNKTLYNACPQPSEERTGSACKNVRQSLLTLGALIKHFNLFFLNARKW